MKVALSHDWLNGMRGGEKCLEVLCELYPDAPIYTLFEEKGKVSETIARHPVRVSRLQNFPKVLSHYRFYLPFYVSAVESFDLSGHDLVVSTSHCVAKGVKKPAGATHVCYCFTPVRYAWALFDDYFGGRDPLTKALIRGQLEKLRKWDLESSARVDHFVAISEHVRRRIMDYYGREADVIYPPADVDFYAPAEEPGAREGYLVVSALVPYKKVDLAIRAFNRMKKRLRVIGSGPELSRLKSIAGSTVSFEGWKSDEAIRDAYRSAKALIFPGEEDFGIVPVEAQACGCPVIALGKGGALETVSAGRSGVFFEEPAEEALCAAVERFEGMRFDPAEARANVLRFSRTRFKNELSAYLAAKTGNASVAVG